MVIPAVKKQIVQKGSFVFQELYCFGEQTSVSFVKEYFSFFFKGKVESSEQAQANLHLIRKDEFKTGAYRFTVKDKIKIEYRDKEGLRNAVATFLQLIELNEGDRYALKLQEIEDYADCQYRSFLIDLARGVPNIEVLKEDIKIASLAKCNKLHLHLMDSLGICYKSDVYKSSEQIRGTKIYSKEEMKDLVAYCDSLGIEIIPEIEVPSHADDLVANYPALKCETSFENASNWVVCAGKEETYAFYKGLIEEICELFPSEYIHIGADELCFDDLPELNAHCHWEECFFCQKKMQEEGFSNRTELYYYVINRICAIVQSFGRKVILWNDEIDISKPVPLSHNCIIQFWRVSNEHRGPRKGCSYRKFLEQGFQVICSPFEYCYVDLEEYANPEKIASFDYLNYEDCIAYKDQVVGCEVCAWEYGNPEYQHYKYSLRPSITLLLAKMWDRKSVVYDKEYRQALSKLLLGFFVPKKYDIFELFGSIMPPRLNDKPSYACVDNELIDKATLLNHKEILEKLEFTYSPIYRTDLLKFLV